jgi:hypothetical protein
MPLMLKYGKVTMGAALMLFEVRGIVSGKAAVCAL